jgi:pimeloyl-ACP methyl ester carboxylesterase
VTRDPGTSGPDDDPTHARHEGDHPEWARFKRPEPEPPLPEAEAEAEPEPPPDAQPEPSVADAAPEAEPDLEAAADPAGADAPPPAEPVAATVPAATWRPPIELDEGIEGRIRRDLARGRRVVWLTWVSALASLVLGLVAIRQAALLVAIDPRLVTTEEVEAAGKSFDAARSVLILTVVVGVLLTVRWIRGALPTLERLRELGLVEGPATGGGLDRLRLLWRPSGVPAEHVGWSDLRVGGGRRLAWITVWVVLAATVVGLAAALLLGAADNADESRLLRVVSGVDGGLWMLASILVGATLDQIRWREAVAARALGVFIPLVDSPSRTLVRIVPPALLFFAGVIIASARPDPWFVPCPSATLACDGMLVPVDHEATAGPTIWVVYALHRAAGEPVGTLAIAVGGPGESGLDVATTIIDSLDPELVQRYNLLFFDQRGVGASEGRDCPHAGFVYATGPATPASARAFASSCVAEAEVDPATVGRYATRQAAEDLDSIRERLGIERFTLYGESYGTELAQVYAALHPDRLNGLILDGPVDLTKTANQFWSDAALGFDRVLSDTLDACSKEDACRSDVPNPSGSYDALLRRFSDARDVSFGDPDGAVRTHRIDAAAIETAVDILLYEPAGRMLIQRAVAASADGDDVPAARLVDALGSGEGVGVSSFSYHAITCADYRVSPTSDASDAAAVEAFGASTGATRVQTSEVYASQYPCLYWPYQPADGTRPPPLTTTPFPVFVLGADDDPITPIEGAQGIAARLSDGYLIRTSGGPHVTFGRGAACVDQAIVGFLLEGRRPATRTVDCPGEVASDYLPVGPTDRSSFATALDVMIALENEVFADPSYVLWDGGDEVRFGCRSGGFVAVTAETVRDGIRFAECAIVPGMPITGTGTYAFGTKAVSWSVETPDGELEYESTPDRAHVAGTWKGEPVDLTR